MSIQLYYNDLIKLLFGFIPKSIFCKRCLLHAWIRVCGIILMCVLVDKEVYTNLKRYKYNMLVLISDKRSGD